MRLCQKHWEELKQKTPERSWLAGNMLIMQKLINLDTFQTKYDFDARALQNAVHENGGCPVCFAGQDLLDSTVAEIKVEFDKK